MRKFLVWITVLCSPMVATADCPSIGTLCDGVEAPSEEDFWAKWNAADLVVYGTPMFDLGCCSYDCGIGSYDGPQPGSCEFGMVVSEVWKGPGPINAVMVATRWMFNVPTGFGPPIPNYAEWGMESCALRVSLSTAGVYFLRDVGGTWETFACFGSGVYDRTWLVNEVGTPVSLEPTTWGGLKSAYR